MSLLTRLKTFVNGGTFFPSELNAIEDQFVAGHNDQEARIGVLEATDLIEAFHVVGALGEPALQNSWIPGGRTPRFYKHDSLVVVSGTVIYGVGGSPNNSTIFQLPVGYRPASLLNFITYGKISVPTAAITVDSTGSVNLNTSATPTASQFSLDGIIFRAGA